MKTVDCQEWAKKEIKCLPPQEEMAQSFELLLKSPSERTMFFQQLCAFVAFTKSKDDELSAAMAVRVAGRLSHYVTFATHPNAEHE